MGHLTTLPRWRIATATSCSSSGAVPSGPAHHRPIVAESHVPRERRALAVACAGLYAVHVPAVEDVDVAGTDVQPDRLDAVEHLGRIRAAREGEAQAGLALVIGD